MLVVAGFILLAAALCLLGLTARNTPRFWAITGLIVCSAALFAISSLSATHTERRSDGSFDKQCRALASSLDRDVLEYRTMIAPDSGWTARDVSRLQGWYRAAYDDRISWLDVCVPELDNPWVCLPSDLDAKSAPRIERASTLIRARRHCDTRDLK